MQDIERAKIAWLTRRLLPLLVACYVIARLDRSNSVMAALRPVA